MHRKGIPALLLAALVVTGCAAGTTRQPSGDTITDFDGTLEATSPSHARLGGSVRAVASVGTTAVFITVSGAEPGAVHPWQLHRGRCGSGGAAVASRDEFPPISVEANGSDRVTTSIPVQLDRGGNYHVNVLLSPDRPDVVVACADLLN